MTRSEKITLVLVLAGVSSLITLCSISKNSTQAAMRMADTLALETAFAIRDEISSSQICPEIPKGWENVSYDDLGMVQIKLGYYRLIYDCEDDLSFTISIRYSFDSGSGVFGETGEPIRLQYGHFTAPKTLTVSTREDIEASLDRVY